MVRTLSMSLNSIPLNAEIAAASLGASRVRVLLEVTLPLARSGGGAGMIFAFISSFDDINLALFVARPGQTPLTVQIMQFLDLRVLTDLGGAVDHFAGGASGSGRAVWAGRGYW